MVERSVMAEWSDKYDSEGKIYGTAEQLDQKFLGLSHALDLVITRPVEKVFCEVLKRYFISTAFAHMYKSYCYFI